MTLVSPISSSSQLETQCELHVDPFSSKPVKQGAQLDNYCPLHSR